MFCPECHPAYQWEGIRVVGSVISFIKDGQSSSFNTNHRGNLPHCPLISTNKKQTGKVDRKWSRKYVGKKTQNKTCTNPYKTLYMATSCTVAGFLQQKQLNSCGKGKKKLSPKVSQTIRCEAKKEWCVWKHLELKERARILCSHWTVCTMRSANKDSGELLVN